MGVKKTKWETKVFESDMKGKRKEGTYFKWKWNGFVWLLWSWGSRV